VLGVVEDEIECRTSFVVEGDDGTVMRCRGHAVGVRPRGGGAAWAVTAIVISPRTKSSIKLATVVDA
jgi:hypothetical protein